MVAPHDICVCVWCSCCYCQASLTPVVGTGYRCRALISKLPFVSYHRHRGYSTSRRRMAIRVEETRTGCRTANPRDLLGINQSASGNRRPPHPRHRSRQHDRVPTEAAVGKRDELRGLSRTLSWVVPDPGRWLASARHHQIGRRCCGRVRLQWVGDRRRRICRRTAERIWAF